MVVNYSIKQNSKIINSQIFSQLWRFFNVFYNFKIEAIDNSEMKNITYPGNNQKIRLEFKYFSRVEGKIRLKKNFKISNISVQLFEDLADDKPKYTSSFRIGKN